MKKQITLEGLNCKRCVDDIVKAIELIDVDVKSIDNMKISIIIKNDKDYESILNAINEVISKHNHQIQISEKVIEKGVGKTLVIGKLTCSHCAKRIEAKVRNITGVKSAAIDFVNSKLNIEVENKKELPRIVKETEEIVKVLEPEAYIVHEEEKEEDDDSKIVFKTILRLVIAAIPFVLGLVLELRFIYELMLFLLSYLIVGQKVIYKAIRNIISGNIFDENTLMMVATIGAFAIGEYHEAVAVMAFYLTGEMFQDLAIDNSRKSIAKLMDIRSDYANLEVKNDIVKVNPTEVAIGSRIVVKPGEKVPIDGIVVSGESTLNTANITGESVPKYVNVGSEVLSGFINQDNPLIIETTKDYHNSTVNKILEMVESASSKKAKTENFITKFSKVYTPVVVLIAFLLAIIPPLAFKADFNTWLYRALSFLVVSCPCALVISIPLGFYAGIGFASRVGILVKGGNYLEALKNSEEIIFDKTGTLTTGEFIISKINVYKYDEEKILSLAALAEIYSIHPIAITIKNFYKKELDKNRIAQYEEYSGMGVVAKIDDDLVCVGNRRLFKKYHIDVKEVTEVGTIIHVALNGEYIGNIVIVDEIKKEAKEALADLRSLGLKKVTMITGDKKEVANLVASNLGIDEVHAEVLPQEKAGIVEAKVKNENKKVIFVGDGVNDAPVLAVSNIGIAMGSLGSDAAIEASDIVIMNDDLRKIAKARKIAKRTNKIVWENIIFALTVKILVLIFAGLGFVNMWIAVFADVGVSLLAVLNAMRLLHEKKKLN